MSTISGVSSASSAWSGMSSARASARSDKMFAKVDTDSSGSVDTSELQSMLDDISSKTGNTLGSASDLMTTMDTDGSGTLSKDELDTGMKSLMPPPSSTLDFAQQQGGMGGMDGMPPPPPPPDGASASSDSSSSTSSTSSTDPLDTNGDGVVSAEERAAGALQDAVTSLFAVADTDGDKTISKSEADTLKQKMDAVLEGLQSASTSSTSGSSSSDSSSSSSRDAAAQTLTAFIDLVLKQYGQTAAASTASATSDASISLTA